MYERERRPTLEELEEKRKMERLPSNKVHAYLPGSPSRFEVIKNNEYKPSKRWK